MFGLDGAFATVPLHALSRAGMTPILVVQGLSVEPRPWRPTARLLSARPTWLDRLRRRSDTPINNSPHDLAAAARRLGIDVLQTANANRRDVVEQLKRIAPDALVVAGFEHLLSPAVLATARYGGLNVHPGQLPQERGPAPLFWALQGGRTQIHWTVHMLDAGEDTGDRVADGQVSFTSGTEGLQILAQVAHAAAPHVVRCLRALVAGDLVRHPQPTEGGARRPRPRFEDGRIDPSKPAHAVFTFVGGCAGRYSLFAEVAGDRFFIRRAVSCDPDATLTFDFVLTGDRLLLRCNPGVVELELKDDGALFSADY